MVPIIEQCDEPLGAGFCDCDGEIRGRCEHEIYVFRSRSVKSKLINSYCIVLCNIFYFKRILEEVLKTNGLNNASNTQSINIRTILFDLCLSLIELFINLFYENLIQMVFTWRQFYL